LVLCGSALLLLARAVARRAHRLDFKGRVVVITGGTRGLGLLLAEEFGLRGARVAVCGRDHEAVERAERRLGAMGIEVLARPVDLGDRFQAELFVERVLCEWQRIDVLVNNAGAIQVAPIEATSLATLEEGMRSNFWSAANTTFAALPALRKQGRSARIVNVTSIGGRVGLPHMLSYTASKFAILGFSEALRAELARARIPVVTVIPGPMRTGSFYNAEFASRSRSEFAWFSVLSSLPIVSIDARRAAGRIVRATAEGSAVVHLGLSAHFLDLAHGISPRFVIWTMQLLDRVLPRPADAPSDTWRGREISSPLQHSRLLTLGNRAAALHNESPPEHVRTGR
jgi:NAD(P)-dependent dehydrogenase (short-subunit alcohol dehydrogenase family)